MSVLALKMIVQALLGSPNSLPLLLAKVEEKKEILKKRKRLHYQPS